MKLKFNAIQILVAELMPDEMGVIYLMGLQKDMPENVTKTVLTNIITFLCKQLDWIEKEEEIIETSKPSDEEGNIEQFSSESVVNCNKVMESSQYESRSGEEGNSNSSFSIEKEKDTVPTPAVAMEWNEVSIEKKPTTTEISSETIDYPNTDMQTQSDPNEKPEILNETPDDPNTSMQIQRNQNEKENSYLEELSDCVEKYSPEKETGSYMKATFENPEKMNVDHEQDLAIAGFDKVENEDPTNGSAEPLNSEKNESPTFEDQSVNSNSERSEQFRCNKCDQNFSKESYLSAHVFLRHEVKQEENHSPENKEVNRADDKPYSCNQCELKFAVRNSLRRHQILHTDKALSCPVCDKKFYQGLYLRRHMLCHVKGTIRSSDHQILKAVPNDNDGIFSDNFSNLDKESEKRQKSIEKTRLRRIMAIETGKFSCSFCDKRYASSMELKRHEKYHLTTIEKNASEIPSRQNEKLAPSEKVSKELCVFSCSSCDKKFQDSRELAKHEKIHTGERPFMCCICGKAFIDELGLKRHEIAHTDNKETLMCSMCGEAFTDSRKLKRHEIAHTNKSNM